MAARILHLSITGWEPVIESSSWKRSLHKYEKTLIHMTGKTVLLYSTSCHVTLAYHRHNCTKELTYVLCSW